MSPRRSALRVGSVGGRSPAGQRPQLPHSALRARSSRNARFAFMLDTLNNQRATFGLEPVATMLEVTARTGPRVAATSPTFDPPGSSVSIVQVGPIRPRPSAPGSGHPAAPVDRPLAVVGLSAGWMHQVELLQRILDALAPLDVWTWMTLGPSVASSELSAPPNAQLFAALPHDAVLPGAALLITHAGHGTVMAGLRHGVPMVCVPLGRDQPVNAARAVARSASRSPSTPLLRSTQFVMPRRRSSAIRR